MSLKSTFLALKKVVQVVQIGVRGGEVIWTKSKRTAAFFRAFKRNKNKYGIIFSMVDNSYNKDIKLS